MSTIHIRAATQKDLPAIEQIEASCFDADLRSSPRALRYSLISPVQSVWVAVAGRETIGVMVLHHHPRSIRIFSIAVLSDFRGSGAGRRMMEKALALARRAGCAAVTLEAEQNRRILISWYEKFGFEIKKILRDYHSPGRHAVRMRLEMKTARQGGRVRGRS
jgi:ribosomal protein S18 acetylase RimI-like enzyme